MLDFALQRGSQAGEPLFGEAKPLRFRRGKLCGTRRRHGLFNGVLELH